MSSGEKWEWVLRIKSEAWDLAARGEKIAAFHADEYSSKDMGRPEMV